MLDVLKLVDVCDDDGAVWDAKGRVVPAQYWTGPEGRRKLWHRGQEAWLNFRGRWGNKGNNDCWWHRLIGICQVGRSIATVYLLIIQLVDGPMGPNRFFDWPPSVSDRVSGDGRSLRIHRSVSSPHLPRELPPSRSTSPTQSSDTPKSTESP